MKELRDAIDKVLIDLLELTKVALHQDFSGDEIWRLGGKKQEIVDKVFEYQRVFEQITSFHEQKQGV